MHLCSTVPVLIPGVVQGHPLLLRAGNLCQDTGELTMERGAGCQVESCRLPGQMKWMQTGKECPSGVRMWFSSICLQKDSTGTEGKQGLVP